MIRTFENPFYGKRIVLLIMQISLVSALGLLSRATFTEVKYGMKRSDGAF